MLFELYDACLAPLQFTMAQIWKISFLKFAISLKEWQDILAFDDMVDALQIK